MKRYIDAAATSIPAATGGKASFGRKRPAEEEVPGPKTPPEAKAKRALPKPLPVKAGSPAVASPKTSPKQDPKSRCQCRSEPKMAAKPLMIGLTAQAPTEIWRSTKGGRLWLAGLPLQSTESKSPLAFEGGWRDAEELCSGVMTFSAAYKEERDTLGRCLASPQAHVMAWR